MCKSHYEVILYHDNATTREDMSMIKLFTDSTIDLTPAECDRLGVTTVPLTIHFGDQSYWEGIDMTHKEFYRRLRESDAMPTTSQINPAQFAAAFAPALQEGHEIIMIVVSSRVSGTCQSAQIAASAVPGRVHVVDSLSGSFGAQPLVYEAARLRDEGKLTAAQIAQALRDLTPRLRLYAVLDTLKYLRKGGRLSGGAALLGGLLGILPLVEVRDGKIGLLGKARGDRAGMQQLLALFQKEPVDPRFGICLAHADDETRLNKYLNYLRPYLGNIAIRISGLGSVIGTHAGPGVVGLSFVVAK
jgi:DegV family protein with EDD domain